MFNRGREADYTVAARLDEGVFTALQNRIERPPTSIVNSTSGRIYVVKLSTAKPNKLRNVLKRICLESGEKSACLIRSAHVVGRYVRLELDSKYLEDVRNGLAEDGFAHLESGLDEAFVIHLPCETCLYGSDMPGLTNVQLPIGKIGVLNCVGDEIWNLDLTNCKETPSRIQPPKPDVVERDHSKRNNVRSRALWVLACAAVVGLCWDIFLGDATTIEALESLIGFFDP